MRLRLWPGGLVGRIALVLILAILLQFGASTVLFEQAELVSVEDADAVRVADALGVAARVLDATPSPDRPTTAIALSQPHLKVGWRATAPAAVGEPALAFHAKLTEENPNLAVRGITILSPADGTDVYRGSLALADGSRLSFELPQPADAIPAFWSKLASVAILSGCVLVLALVVVRTLGSPLRTLAVAADSIGKGPAVHLDEVGPREIRRVAQAFNAMEARIDRLIRDRTEALAAVSHDLRTPIARLRLRSGLLDDKDDQAAFASDLGEMEGMINALMAFLNGETDPEKPRLVDLAAMLETLVNAATDADFSATYDGPARHVVSVRPLAMKRAFSNIINNALAYGGRADVALRPGARTIIRVRDAGPGIAASELAAVFEPFYRLDAARTAGSGGMGLGLSIARQVVAREGGTIALDNDGGLVVTIEVPGAALTGMPGALRSEAS